VVVIDGERTFADALAIRLDAETDVHVVAVAQAAAVASALAAGLQADVILLDADLAGDAVNRLGRASAGAANAGRVVMLSRTSEPSRIVDAIQAGAFGWVRKDESVEHLLQVVRGVARGETWLPPAETGSVLTLLLRQRDGRQASDRLLTALTPRERQVLACLADGAGRHETAERLHLSANTVRTYLQNIMAKLEVHSALEAVALTRSGLDPSAPPAAAPDARR
jgi:DNA-binding NarL/FixJ family response regulator